MKEILSLLLAEIEDLRANQAVIAGALAHPPTAADALDAKSLAIQAHKKIYDELRAKISALP